MSGEHHRNERILAVMREIDKIGLCKTTTYDKALYRIGVVAAVEAVVDLFPDYEPKRIVRLLVRQALTDFIVAQEPYQKIFR